ncbi:MAG TPA: serine protease [Usitatibacter sp.]|nr:serine protease [Usitatibacter sp.]
MKIPAVIALCLLFVAGSLAPGALAERNFSAAPPAGKSAHIALSTIDALPATPIHLGPLDPATVRSIRAKSGPGLRELRLGVVREAPESEPAASRVLDWHAVPGGRAAQWRVVADDAKALRVELSIAAAPRGARVRFAGANGSEVRDAPLPVSGTLWGPVIEGSEARIELFAPAGVDPASIAASVASVGHFVVDPQRRSTTAGSQTAGTCEVDVACVASTDPDLARVASAVSRLTYVKDGSVWACTGTLLNPGDGSFAPYYLTAAHCVSDAATASTVSVLWFDDAPTCGGGTARDPVQSAAGAQLLFADPTLDGALLRLNEMPPEGVVYAGWDSLPTADGTPVAAIHHPDGGVKKVSEGLTDASPDERFLAASWTSGVTEGGSSGSGLFAQVDSPRRDWLLRGTLVGGSSACTASGPAGTDYYSRLDRLWPQLAPYLSAEAKEANFSGIWWNPAEPGWGIEVSHQQGAVMAALFGYADDGTPEWLVAPQMQEQSDGDFAGDAFRMTGPRFDAASWSGTVAHSAGAMRLTFSAADRGHLSYTEAGVAVEKDITPMVFGPTGRAVCSFTNEDRAVETNYQDLWWDPAESGWGLAIAHQGDTLFAVLFTYADDGTPMWLAGPNLTRGADGRYSGSLYRTRGAPLAAAWHAASAAAAGNIAIEFADGDSATVEYSIDGRAVRKPITRISASPSAPACR